MTQLTASEKLQLADFSFSLYHFGGDEVEVLGQQSWNRDDPEDYTQIVYVRFVEDSPETESQRISFHVRFTEEDDALAGIYALDMAHGYHIGHSPLPAEQLMMLYKSQNEKMILLKAVASFPLKATKRM